PAFSRHRGAQSVEAGRGRPLVDARHEARRQCDAAVAPSDRQGLPRPQLQRLSAAAGPLLSRLYRRRHVRARHFRQGQSEEGLVVDQLAALYRLHAHDRAAVRSRLDAGHDESTENNAKDWPKLIWVLDARDETNLVPISTCPLPDPKVYAEAGRFGAHNIHKNVPLP